MKKCRLCSSEFTISSRDRVFFQRAGVSTSKKTYSIPEPSFCPSCRMQRRLVWRSELHLYKRKSDLSGKDLLSHFPQGSPCKVYSPEEILSDSFDALEYGQDYNPEVSFFEQFKSLLSKVPLPSTSTLNNQNSPYVNNTFDCKNCYLIAGSSKDEDCYYGTYLNYCKNCVDCCFIHQCELCYECIDCRDCYNSRFCFNTYNSSDSWFLHNCQGCKNCFGSVNLVRSKFVFFNEQLSEKEYNEKVSALKLHTRSGLERAKEMFEEHRLRFPYRSFIGEGSENSSGNLIYNCKNTTRSFDVTGLEDCAYCAWFHQAKDCLDCYSWGLPAELCYESVSCGNYAFHNLFCSNCYSCVNIYYSLQLRSCKDCFGCISLQSKKYCILNKEYSAGDYHALLERIIEQMTKDGEWGEFFPFHVSPFAYNTTIAQDYFPLDEETAKAIGADWHHDTSSSPDPSLNLSPDSLQSLNSQQLKGSVYRCAESSKPFRIIQQEYEFYKKMGLPPPALCPENRHVNRIRRRSPRFLWERECAKCKIAVETAYSPGSPETIFCDSCYQQEVYS